MAAVPVVDEGELASWLGDAVRRAGVPGAALAVLSGDHLVEAQAGVRSVVTAEPVRADTVFQVGSTAKVMTAAILLQFVDAGDLAVDTPVGEVLGGFRVGDADVDGVTIRRLLDHTSGLPGHHFADFGPGPDAIARYVASMADLDMIHPPGLMYSYCNGGYVVGGAIAETVGRRSFAELVLERIARPIGLSSTTTRPDEVDADRIATGHELGDRGRHRVAPVQAAAWSSTPAGSQMLSTAAELARFGRAASRPGVLVSDRSAELMTAPSVDLPCPYWGRRSQCAGWGLDVRGGRTVLLHGGGTTGHTAMLLAVPEEFLVVALLTNSADGAALMAEAEGWLLGDVAGLPPPTAPPPADHELSGTEADAVIGTYTDIWTTLAVERDENGIVATRHVRATSINEAWTSPATRLRPVDARTFISEGGRAVCFLGADPTDAISPITYAHQHNAARRPGAR